MRPHPLLQSSFFSRIACSPSPSLHLVASSWRSLAAVIFILPFLKFSYLRSASCLRLNRPIGLCCCFPRVIGGASLFSLLVIVARYVVVDLVTSASASDTH
ncbi:hypothetical protein S83_036004 [Arachis hypogaea]